MRTKTSLSVGRWLADREEMDRRLVRRLAEAGRLDLIDAIYGEDETPALLCGSSPRLKAVTK